jgi:hypothetical protein
MLKASFDLIWFSGFPPLLNPGRRKLKGGGRREERGVMRGWAP